jgi:hypothetical protein
MSPIFLRAGLFTDGGTNMHHHPPYPPGTSIDDPPPPTPPTPPPGTEQGEVKTPKLSADRCV